MYTSFNFPVYLKFFIIKCWGRDFPGGPAVKNPPSNTGDAGSIRGRGTRIPHTVGQLSPRAANYRAHSPWSVLPTTREKPARHNEEPLVPQRKYPSYLSEDPACHN